MKASETWIPIYTPSSITTNTSDIFEAPSAVLQTAVIPFADTLRTIDIRWFADISQKILFVLHFSEIQELPPNTSRVFDIFFNDDLFVSNYWSHYLRAGYVYNLIPSDGKSDYQFSLKATPNSTLSPILNAVEVYEPKEFVEVVTDRGDVEAMISIKKQYQLKKNWTGDPCAPKGYVWDGVICSYGADKQRVISLDLSSSALTGVLSSSFAMLTEIKYLDLSHNYLIGAIPDTLGNLSSLQVLNLQCNNLTGPVPPSLLKKSEEGLLTLRYTDSTNTCSTWPPTPNKKISTPIIAVISAISLLILLVLAFAFWKISGRVLVCNTHLQPHYEGNHDQKLDDVDHQIKLDIRQFTYSELVDITDNFSTVIGKGGFGMVYLGHFRNKKQVAVKILSESSEQGTKEFLSEIQILPRIHHKNLVFLLGYYMEKKQLALVYEYMPHGSLNDHLKGLEYLHRGCNPPIIHRDVKTHNILLGQNLEAKISDLGLCKVFQSESQTHISIQSLAGTPGYLDPECHTTWQQTDKSDVYSFGVVLLELITGKPPLVKLGSEITHIFTIVRDIVEAGRIHDIIDERLQGSYNVDSALKVVELASMSQKGRQRPTMSEVVLQLKACLHLLISYEPSKKRSHINQTIQIVKQETK